MTDEIRRGTLEDLKTADVNVIIELADGEEVSYPMRTLSYMEYNRIRWSVPDPTPPPMGVDKNGRPLYDWNNAGFLRAKQEAELQRQYKVLLASLKLDIPGEDEAAKLTFLQNDLDTSIGQQLMLIAIRMANKGDARIASRAERFQNGHTAHSDQTDMLATAPDANGMGNPL